ALRALLREADADVRLQVVSLLQRGGGDEKEAILSAMTGLLEDGRKEIRLRAAEVLWRQGVEGQEAARPVFREALKDAEPNTRLRAAQHMLQTFPAAPHSPADRDAATAVVADLLRGGDSNLRLRAASVLGMVRPPEGLRDALPALREALRDADPRVRVQIALLLARQGGDDRETGLAALAEIARGNDLTLRSHALSVLRSMGPDGERVIVPALVESLKDPAQRIRTLSELSAVRPESLRAAAPALKELLDDPQSPVRLQVARLLARLGGRETEAAAEALAALLKDPSPGTRSSAALALREMGPKWNKVTAPVFRELLKDPQVSTRLTAAQYLLQTDGADRGEIVAVLEAVLREGRESDRVRAAEMLARAAPDRAGEAAAALTELLKDPRARRFALAALARLGVPHAEAAVPALREMLKGPGLAERQMAASLIGQIGPAARAAIPDLVELLKDRNTSGTAVTALGRLGPDAVPALLGALESGEGQVRAEAVRALGMLGRDARAAAPHLAKLLLGDDAALREQAVSALGQIGGDAGAELARGLKDAAPARRRAAAEMLARLNWAARATLTELEQAAADADRLVRLTAARAAFQAGSRADAVVHSLAEGLKAEEPEQRRETASLVSGFWPLPEPLVRALRVALDDPDRLVRVHAARGLTLSKEDAPDAAAVLAAALKDPDLRLPAVNALALPGRDPEVFKVALPGLREVLKDPAARRTGYLAHQAGTALVRLRSPDAAELIADAMTDRETRFPAPYAYTLRECGPKGVAALRKLLTHADAPIRLAALDSLAVAARSDADLVPDLAARLKDTDPGVRVRAATALGAAGPGAESAAAELAGLLKDASPAIRLEAAVALGRIGAEDGRPEAVAVLRDLLQGRWRTSYTPPSPVSTARVLEGLGLFGEGAAGAVPEVLPHLEDRNPLTRSKAAEALGRIGRPADAAAPALAEMLKDLDRRVRVHTAVALWRIKGEPGPVVPVLAQALADPMLRHMRSPAAMPAMPFPPPSYPDRVRVVRVPPDPTASEPSLYLEVIRTLGETGPEAKPAAAALRAALNDANPDVRAAAAAALKRVERMGDETGSER
ncbi:MAG TPA: HEAT repeat domain-containing protein, partial [Gemmataceae bacterium]